MPKAKNFWFKFTYEYIFLKPLFSLSILIIMYFLKRLIYPCSSRMSQCVCLNCDLLMDKKKRFCYRISVTDWLVDSGTVREDGCTKTNRQAEDLLFFEPGGT